MGKLRIEVVAAQLIEGEPAVPMSIAVFRDDERIGYLTREEVAGALDEFDGLKIRRMGILQERAGNVAVR